jgi:acyl carrier protein
MRQQAVLEQVDRDIKLEVRQFLSKNFYVPDASKLRNETSLLDQGIIDSTGVLELVGFLEETFGISVLDTETLPENLDSVDRIAAYVQRKQTRAA